MKYLVAITLLAMVSFISCIKPINTEVPSPTTPTKNTTCMIDGDTFKANASATVDQYGFITLKGNQPDEQNITLSLSGTRPGVYMLDQNSLSVAWYLSSFKANMIHGFNSFGSSDASGMITITSINPQAKTFSGVFNFLAVRNTDRAKRNVTNGIFTDVPFSGNLPMSSSTLYAKIGNTGYTMNDVLFQTDTHVLTMTAKDNYGHSIVFSWPDAIGPGTYQLSYPGSYNATCTTAGKSYESVSGEVIIVARNSTGISGAYHFKGVNQFNLSDKVDISSGSFDAQF